MGNPRRVRLTEQERRHKAWQAEQERIARQRAHRQRKRFAGLLSWLSTRGPQGLREKRERCS